MVGRVLTLLLLLAAPTSRGDDAAQKQFPLFGEVFSVDRHIQGRTFRANKRVLSTEGVTCKAVLLPAALYTSSDCPAS